MTDDGSALVIVLHEIPAANPAPAPPDSESDARAQLGMRELVRTMRGVDCPDYDGAGGRRWLLIPAKGAPPPVTPPTWRRAPDQPSLRQ